MRSANIFQLYRYGTLQACAIGTKLEQNSTLHLIAIDCVANASASREFWCDSNTTSLAGTAQKQQGLTLRTDEQFEHLVQQTPEIKPSSAETISSPCYRKPLPFTITYLSLTDLPAMMVFLAANGRKENNHSYQNDLLKHYSDIPVFITVHPYRVTIQEKPIPVRQTDIDALTGCSFSLTKKHSF